MAINFIVPRHRQMDDGVTLYADLWDDRKADPGDIRVGVIRQALTVLQPDEALRAGHESRRRGRSHLREYKRAASAEYLAREGLAMARRTRGDVLEDGALAELLWAESLPIVKQSKRKPSAK